MKKPTARDVRLLTLYGITEAEYALVLRHQGGVCAICRRPPVRYRLSVDHLHASGVARGLVCRQCNRGLAYFRDSLSVVAAARAYLDSYPANAALGFIPEGRPGRVTRGWRTKRERRERMVFVATRLSALGFSVPRSVARWILTS